MKYNNILIEKHVFFLVAKAANSSIKAAIKEYKGQKVEPNSLHRGHDFISPCEALTVMGKKIAFVRNPWDRVVSCYYQKIVGDGHSNLLKMKPFFKGMSFAEFVKGICEHKDTNEAHIRNQTAHMMCNGVFVPDMIIKFEQLSEKWPVIQKIIPGLPDLKKLNRSKHPYYKTLFSEKLKSLVAKRYQKDLRLFNYEF